ncbi:hypothetical protein [Streptomyces hiroshimensis]|uniref:Uncharacterized protein n=1 Tax=Streptomyces hiroshimensis TaxID=66424 RepID=A0ABQ2YBL4_9ACTN|nr:hypothetical protein [Streptomyces hiroshimensis]GGX76268.1 hypothetical protein GCM10010324_22400 [Streptomyces hiroshimensis]
MTRRPPPGSYLAFNHFTTVMANVRAASTEMQQHVDVPFVKAWQLLAPLEHTKVRPSSPSAASAPRVSLQPGVSAVHRARVRWTACGA